MTSRGPSAVAAEISQSIRWAPPPGLRGIVACYHGYRQEGLPPGQHRGLPSPYLTLIITLDDPLTVIRHPDPAAPPGSYTTLAGGLHTTPALITHDGRQSGVQLAVHPLAARAMFGLPAGELASVDADAGDVLGRTAAQMHEQMREAAGWPERFAVLDRLLLARAAQAGRAAVHPAIAEAWRMIASSGGTVRAAEVAAAVGWSPRHLQARFQAETGLTPKAAARVTRFHRARILLQRRVRAGRPTGLASLAAGCGYSDQAHLAREFRDLAGCPPSAWIAEEFRIVQAMGPGGEPDCPHDGQHFLHD